MSWVLFASDALAQSSTTLTVRVQVLPACEAAAAANASGAEVFALCGEQRAPAVRPPGVSRAAAVPPLGVSRAEAMRPVSIRVGNGRAAGGERVEVWTVIY